MTHVKKSLKEIARDIVEHFAYTASSPPEIVEDERTWRLWLSSLVEAITAAIEARDKEHAEATVARIEDRSELVAALRAEALAARIEDVFPSEEQIEASAREEGEYNGFLSGVDWLRAELRRKLGAL